MTMKVYLKSPLLNRAVDTTPAGSSRPAVLVSEAATARQAGRRQEGGTACTALSTKQPVPIPQQDRRGFSSWRQCSPTWVHSKHIHRCALQPDAPLQLVAEHDQLQSRHAHAWHVLEPLHAVLQTTHAWQPKSSKPTQHMSGCWWCQAAVSVLPALSWAPISCQEGTECSAFCTLILPPHPPTPGAWPCHRP